MFFGWFDAIFSFIFPILFLLFMGMFFFALISNLRTWNKNNHSPRLTVPATVVAKRTDVSHSAVPMPEICPVRTDTTPARSRHTM